MKTSLWCSPIAYCLVVACALVGGCASPDFTPYVGEQDWPQGTGCTIKTNGVVPIYYRWPDKPYTVLGVITLSGINDGAVARCAKSKGADALIFRTILTDDAGSYTTPGHATSFTSGGYIGDQYSDVTTTTYSPGVTIPLTVTVSVYDAIKWNPLKTGDSGRLDSESATTAARLATWQAGLGGSEPLDSKTLKTAETSAQRGNVVLQSLLASIYRDGVGGVQKNPAKAAYWYLRAAKQGDDTSQLSLGEMYQQGDGVMQDYVEAYKWFNIAAAAPSPEIDWDMFTNYMSPKDVETLKKQSVPVSEKAKATRDQLAQQMTPQQIAEAQRRSEAFFPQTETPDSNSPSNP